MTNNINSMRSRFLYIGLLLVLITLLASCLDVPVDSEDIALETDSPLAPVHDRWLIENITESFTYLRLYHIVEDGLYYFSSEGIRCLDLISGQISEVSSARIHTNIQEAAESLWFTYNSLWGYFQEFPKDQLPLARFDLVTDQYIEYPVDMFTGFNVWVMDSHSLGKTVVLAGNQLYEYDRANDQFVKMPEYGEHVWRIAGNEEMFITYEFNIAYEHGYNSPEDALKIYHADGAFQEYQALAYLPRSYVIDMYLVEDVLFLCWGGEGSAAGVACLNTQTGDWLHYLDLVQEHDFTTQLEHIQISGYAGEVWASTNAAYLRLRDDDTDTLYKYSFSQQQFEHLYEIDGVIIDAIPFQDGDVIAQYDGLVFMDADGNAEYLLEDTQIYTVLEKSPGTIFVTTDQGILQCIYLDQ